MLWNVDRRAQSLTQAPRFRSHPLHRLAPRRTRGWAFNTMTSSEERTSAESRGLPHPSVSSSRFLVAKGRFSTTGPPMCSTAVVPAKMNRSPHDRPSNAMTSSEERKSAGTESSRLLHRGGSLMACCSKAGGEGATQQVSSSRFSVGRGLPDFKRLA